MWLLNRIFWGTHFHSIYNGSDSFTGFLVISLVSLIFSSCVKWNTFFITTFLPLHNSFIQGWFTPSPSFENLPLLFSFTKNPKILFAPPFNEKTQWKATYMKQQKWIYQIFLEADRPHQVSLDIGFKSHLLSMKKKHTPTTDIITAIQTAKWSKSTHTHTHIYILHICK